MAINQKWSYKSWKRKTYAHLSAAEFDGEIIGACFHQDPPYTDAFPAGIRTTFINTTLDNCKIPPGATVGPGTDPREGWQDPVPCTRIQNGSGLQRQLRPGREYGSTRPYPDR